MTTPTRFDVYPGFLRSVRTRIIILTVAAVLVSTLLVGIISIFAVKQAGDRGSEELMRLMCENGTHVIDEYLNSIEQSVNLLSHYAEESLNSAVLTENDAAGFTGSEGAAARAGRSTLRQARLDGYLHSYLRTIEDFFHSSARHTSGVVAYYYRINPELSASEPGFLYSAIGLSDFEKITPTEIERYDPDDDIHVAWYYVPLSRGEPSWLAPYWNENLGILMLSYVTPIYAGGTFLGVLGMDISYDTLVEQISDIRLLDSGYACLMDTEGNVIYHPAIAYGTDLAELDPEIAGTIQSLELHERSGGLMQYKMFGISKRMCFDTLGNGLKLIVCAPAAEIDENWVLLTQFILLATIGVLVFFAAVVAMVMQRVTEPLHRLTEAARSLSEGNYDVKLDYDRDDEVGILTRAFQHMADHLRVYISDLNSKAYQDAMTGVKNKGAYEALVRQTDAAIAAGEATGEIALLMMDCNGLKQINDRYGHEKGDIYLRVSCALICDAFPHSPVFRLGGDEFAVVLQAAPFRDREELLRAFDERAVEANAAARQPWEQVRIAKGLAVYDPALDHSLDDTLRRADEIMYEDKRRSKAAAGLPPDAR
ncbi:MAG: diguanylate cyclase [Oscillospiraceae bacterium]|nr:diguanylate cyclase [Oscillospiraceae bacterium]